MKNLMFYVPLFQYQIEDWEVKKRKLKEIYNQSDVIENDKSYVKTDYYKQGKEGFNHCKKIEEILNDEINLFKNESDLHEYKITGSWFELSLKGDYHEIHNHGSVGYSSVCFIDFDTSVHKGTVFLSPFDNFLTADTLQYPSDVNEGTIIFFPSTIKHYTNPHNSIKERLILSFNMMVR